MKLLVATLLWTLLTLKLAISRESYHGVKWNKRIGQFVPIVESNCWETERRKIVVESRRLESHGFDGNTLNFTYFEDYGFFQFRDNNTRVTGVYGEIYTILSKFLNFTLVLTNSGDMSLGIKLANGSFSGILEYARLNETDVIPRVGAFATRVSAVTFTPDFWMNRMRIFAHDQWKRNRAWMFTLVSTEMWCLIGIVVVTLSGFSLVTEKILLRHVGHPIRSRSFSDYFFHVSSTLCNQGNERDGIAGGSKVLALTINVFCWLIFVGYSSQLIYSMTEETFDAPFDDLDTLLKDTKLKIVVLAGSTAHDCFASKNTYAIFNRIWTAERVEVLPNVEQLHSRVCYNPNEYVMFESEDVMAARKKTVCGLLPVGLPYYSTPASSGVSRRVKNKRALDIGIMKLHEFGILDAIKKRYMSPPKRDVGYRQIDSLTIDMDRVSMIFAILSFGLIASIVICVAENLFYYLNKRKTQWKLFFRRLFTMKRRRGLFAPCVYQ